MRGGRSSSGKYQRPKVCDFRDSHTAVTKAHDTPLLLKRPKIAKAGRSDLKFSGTESDGEGALRDIEAAEGKSANRRGPENKTLKHWRPAVLVRDTKSRKPRWEFKCRYCAS